MTADVTVDTVLQAIDALYLNPDSNIKEQASKWLCNFQNSIFAWEISDQLLYLKRDLNSCYFGAQTIRIKIQCNFTELPIHSHAALKNSLLEHVNKLTADTSVPIANQLCLAVADLFCHMVQWEMGIKEIIDRLSTSDTSCVYLIEILKFIAEEMTSSTLRLGLNRRHALMSQFEESKKYVLDILSLKAKSAEMPVLTRIFNCLASWWDNTGVMTEGDLQVSPLLETVFCVLQNPASTPEDTYDSASQWVLALLYHLKGFARCSSNLLTWLQINIYGLAQVMTNCAQLVSSLTGQEQQQQLELCKDRCMCLAHIFASLTRTLRPALVDQPSPVGSGAVGDLRTLECLLAVLELPPPIGSRELVAVTFHALNSLADDAIRHRSVATSYGSGLNCNGQQNVESLHPVSALLPYFTRVVVALTRFCPSNSADLESIDELRDFRDDVHDLMQDILGLVGAESLFVELYNHVQQLQSIAQSHNAQITPAEILRESEACLFMLTTVAKRLSPHDAEGHISNLISGLVLPGLSGPCPYPLQEVGCLLYMELAHWAACHPVLRREMVNQLVGIVEKAAGVESSRLEPGHKVAVAAALSALGSLCAVYRATTPLSNNGAPPASADRTGLLDDHWDALVQRVAFNLPRLAWSPLHDASHFFTGVGRGLLSSVGAGAGGVAGVEVNIEAARRALPARLAHICSVSLECLNKLMEGNVPVGSSDSLTDPRVWLDYLSAVFRAIGALLHRMDHRGKSSSNWPANGPSPTTGAGGDAATVSLAVAAETCISECLRLVREMIWPVVAKVLSHYANRGRPMEHTCRLIRFIVRCFSVHLCDLLPDMAEKIVLAFKNGCQHSSFLYLASVLVDEFGELADCRVGLVQVYAALAGPTLKSLAGPGLVQQPHTIEDLFRLCTRLVQHCPVIFLTSQQVDLNELCETAVRSLGLSHTTPSSGDDNSGNTDNFMNDGGNTTGDNDNGASANTSASAAADRFFIDMLVFTGEASEVTPSAIAKAMIAGGQLPQPSCPSAMAAQRVLMWLICSPQILGGGNVTSEENSQVAGGQRLVSASLQACCLGLSEERFPELANILHHLKVMTKNELFLNWLDVAVTSLPILRGDGLVHATLEQIKDFKDCVTNSTRSSGIVHALESFSRLFR